MPLELHPFKVHFSDDQLRTLKSQVAAAHIARPTFEASEAAGAGEFGVKRDWLLAAKDRWLDGFDWRAQETRINSFTQYTALVPQASGRPFKIHFILERPAKPTASIPILLLHGWPGSVFEFLDLVDILRKTGDYTIVVPSLPGYLFSDAPPLDADFNLADVARLMNDLMLGLGFAKYGVQAGDVGSRIARIMAVKHDAVHCVHLNLISVQTPPAEHPIESLSLEEKKGLQKALKFINSGRGYSLEHGTRPSTIGFAIASSPIALLSWIGEKYLEWSDKDPSIDESLTVVTAWYITDTFPTSIYNYRDPTRHDDPAWFIGKPTAYSSFAEEILVTPISWAATTCNLVWSKYHSTGGHFAALEEPELLAADIQAFLRQVW